MSALESLHFSTEHRHPTVIEILLLLRKLERKGFHIIFSWVPGHVGILGNEQADTAARSMSDHMQRPVCYRDLKTSTQNYIHRVWQETWDQQMLNKLHSIHPSTSHWAALPVRRHDVRLTRLHIGHTRFTHRHLLLGENAPECPSLAKFGPCATKPHIHIHIHTMSHHMQRPVCYQDLKSSAQNYVHRVWQETWEQQVLNKLHSIHPSTSHWTALPVRRHDVRLTRLCFGHTRFTHRHLPPQGAHLL
ncbi:RNase H domain-containing protein [Trichonephila clavipes]|nr:RNase H domain-containing protein [Trichonephila clavipes]